MAAHRGETRRVGVRPRPASPGTADRSAAAGVSVEEGFVPDVDVLPVPAGFGTEATTTTQSFTEVARYSVPAKTLARLREVSLSIPSNGQAKVTVAGTTYGPYSGQLDASVPLDPGILTEGYEVAVFHQSTDGNSATTQAQLVVLEV